MNCRGWNPHIALFVEGDLDPEMARQLETHLRACVECWSFFQSLRETQSEIRQIRNDVIETSSLNRVRSNVLLHVRAIDGRRTWLDRAGIWLWGGYRWRYAVLGCVAFVLVAVMMWRESSTPVRLQEIAAAIPPVAEVPKSAEVAVPISIKKVPNARRRMKPVQTEAPTPKPDTLVQILTDDPNVVIYWLIDQTGGF